MKHNYLRFLCMLELNVFPYVFFEKKMKIERFTQEVQQPNKRNSRKSPEKTREVVMNEVRFPRNEGHGSPQGPLSIQHKG